MNVLNYRSDKRMAKKNIDYGIMIRRRICEKYKLDVDAASQRRFDVFLILIVRKR